MAEYDDLFEGSGEVDDEKIDFDDGDDGGIAEDVEKAKPKHSVSKKASDDRDAPASEYDKTSNTDESSVENNIPFYKKPNGIIAISGAVALVGVAAYSMLLPQDIPNNGNIGVLPAAQVASISQNATASQLPVSQTPSVAQGDWDGGTKDPLKTAMNPCSYGDQLSLGSTGNDVAEKAASMGSSNGFDSIKEKGFDSNKASVLEGKIKEISLKMESLNAALRVSYQIIDGNIKEIKALSSENSVKLGALKTATEAANAAELKHYKNLYWKVSKINKARSKSISSKKIKTASKSIAVKAPVKIKDFYMTSVVNGTAWIRSRSGKNFKLSVGDYLKSGFKVSEIFSNKVVFENGTFIPFK